MFNEAQIKQKYINNMCEVCITIPKPTDKVYGQPIENIKNCDIFVEECNLFIYIDVKLFRLFSSKKFNIADIKNLDISYDTRDRIFKLVLPCESPGDTESEPPNLFQNKSMLKLRQFEQDIDLWKLKRITSCCKIRIDNCPEALELETSFSFGFASKFRGKINSGESDLESVCRISAPNLSSPIQRSIDREIDELKSFDRDQYKLNFIDLQVTEGHENPIDYSVNWQDDSLLTQEEECLLHNLLSKEEDILVPEQYNQTEVDCGLISIILAICYDVRTTSNEPTCESAWTRSILTPVLYYFEPFTSFRNVIIAFLRRSLIYPLYRNYDLGRLCVEDTIDTLCQNKCWITKQLLVTQILFASRHNNRVVLNKHYINDYIRYVSSENLCSKTHLQMLANNLKNVLYDISKKHLRLDLAKIESEVISGFLKQESPQINTPTISEEDATTDDDDPDAEEEDDDGTSDEYETETSSASDTDENSVIEQCIEGLKP